MVAQSFIQELLNRVDIVDVITRHLPLKKKGVNFTACCPFHDEKTPSFSVSQSKQFYHFFGCGKHGNAIDLRSEYSGVSFSEAGETIAADAGLSQPPHEIEIPAQFHGNQATASSPETQKDTLLSSVNLHACIDVAAKY